MDKQAGISQSVDNVFSLWQNQRIIIHKHLTPKIKRAICRALIDYPIGDICNAIRNYGRIVNDDDYWYTVRMSLESFLANKLEVFLDDSKPFEAYLKFNKSGDKERQGVLPPPDPPALSPDDFKNYAERFVQWKKSKQQK